MGYSDWVIVNDKVVHRIDSNNYLTGWAPVDLTLQHYLHRFELKYFYPIFLIERRFYTQGSKLPLNIDQLLQEFPGNYNDREKSFIKIFLKIESLTPPVFNISLTSSKISNNRYIIASTIKEVIEVLDYFLNILTVPPSVSISLRQD